jgi:hypothetical protein
VYEFKLINKKNDTTVGAKNFSPLQPEKPEQPEQQLIVNQSINQSVSQLVDYSISQLEFFFP